MREVLDDERDQAAYDRARIEFDRRINEHLDPSADPSTVWDLRESDYTGALLVLGVITGRHYFAPITSMHLSGVPAQVLTEMVVDVAFREAEERMDNSDALRNNEQTRNYTKFVLATAIDMAMSEMAESEEGRSIIESLGGEYEG